MKLKLLTLAGLGVFSLSLGACANNPNDAQAAASRRQNEVCTYHAPIGSHIGNRQCESRDAHDAQQKANHKQAQKNSDMDSGGGGGR